MGKLILVINPGSTSTKISVFDGNNEIFKKTFRFRFLTEKENYDIMHSITDEKIFQGERS